MYIIPITLGAKPGVQRDGTRYVSNCYTAAKNTRFYRGWPSKMGGWKNIIDGNNEIVYSMAGVPKSQSHDIYLGKPSSVSFFNLTNDGTPGPLISRTPTSGFTPNAFNLWSFTTFSIVDNAGNSEIYIVGQVAPNNKDITNETQGGVFYGSVQANTPLTQISDTVTGPILVSGGVVAAFGLLIVLDNAGFLRWCKTDSIGDLSDWGGNQTIASTKLVAAILYQGALLVWSLDTLYRLNYVPDSGFGSFQVQPIMTGISIWSAQSIVSYQNNLFWVGKGQFYQFNGSVIRVNNLMNNTWFFGSEGINREFKGRLSGFVDEQNDEIWWMYPRGPNTENNNAAVIYSPTANFWNDTEIDRSVALNLTTFDYRIMASTKTYPLVLSNGQIIQVYPIWQHEFGFNEDWNGHISPIEAFFEYPIKDFFTDSPSAESNICIQTFRIEPDFIMSVGTQQNPVTMNAYLINRMYAQADPMVSEPYEFDGSTTFIDIKPTQGRLVSVRFTMNCIDGYFEAGRILHGIQKGSPAA